jgi:hypothetical protein
MMICITIMIVVALVCDTVIDINKNKNDKEDK